MSKDNEVRLSTIKLLVGIAFILFGVMSLINIGFIAQTFVIMFTFIFGFVAYWFFFPSFIIFGLYLIISRKKELKIKKNVYLIGIGLLVFSLLILVTTLAYYPKTDDKTLMFSNFNQYYIEAWQQATANVFKGNNYIRVNVFVTRLGGGWFGYLFASLINSLLTPLGTILSMSVIIFISLILLFHVYIAKGFEYIKNKRMSNKAKKTLYETENLPNVEVQPANNNLFESELQDINREDNYANEIQSNSMFAQPSTLEKANLFATEEIISNNVSNIKEESIINENINNTSINNETNIQEEVLKAETPIMKPYELPSVDLLDDIVGEEVALKNDEASKTYLEIINATFANFRVGAKAISYTIGPRVTRFDVQLEANASLNAIPRVVMDISQRLGGIQARFEPIVVGKTTSGLEVANRFSSMISFKEIFNSMPKGDKNKLLIPFGKNISGEIKFANLAKFPHLLVAGSTGSGKTVFVHSIIMSLIMHNTPEELKLLLIDPKRVEFTKYKNLPFLLCPTITEPKKAQSALTKLSEEMERRYTLFESSNTNEISKYNDYARSNNLPTIPYIVAIVDEFADLIANNKKIDLDIAKITAKARAAGIHLIVATQRPSVDVITGTIKNNLPVRVALSVSDAESSKTILGQMGAEKLLGNGDMLVLCPSLQSSGYIRAQGCYVSDNEINRVVNFINQEREPQYDVHFMNLEDHVVEDIKSDEPKISAAEARKNSDDDLYEYIKEQAYKREYTSISIIQRENQIGFTRAGRLFQRLQNEGLVSLESEASKGSKVIKENFKFEEKEQKIGSEELSETKPL